VIRIPGYMEREAPELVAYEAHLDKLQEERDRATYAYLKRKFEGE
jgi:hypothetical protein